MIPIVSVVIPTYGHAEFILQTLDSVFAQTFRDFEIIVVNDGSPDRTEDVLKPLIDSRKIHYYSQKNAGVATARNVGITHSLGKYIAFLDDDDLWPPDKLEWQVKEMEGGTAIAIGGSTGLVGPDGQLIPSTDAGEELRLLEFEELFDGNPFVSPGQVLIDSDVVKKIGGFDSQIWGADDYDFFMRLWQEGPLLKSPRIGLYYRIHHSNASHNTLRMITNTKKALSKQFRDLSGLKKSRCRSRGYLWMFQYLGGVMILEILGNLKKRPKQLTQAFSFAKGFLEIFGKQLLIDPRLRRRVIGFLLRLLPNFPGAKLILADRNK